VRAAATSTTSTFLSGVFRILPLARATAEEKLPPGSTAPGSFIMIE
jgi:hypothetical protein